MAIPVEQFTAPGKYDYDLAMELIESELKISKPLYNNKYQSEKNNKFSHKLYNISFNIEKK